MYSRDFKLDKRKFRRRKSSILQHKLRVVMNCYTIVDFLLDDEKNSFSFKKSHKINGLRMNDSKEYAGRFEVYDLDDENVCLRIIIGETNANK